MICLHCGNTITGTYYKDWAGNIVCTSCHNRVHRCVSCGQYCDHKAKNIDDGKMICENCQRYYMRKKDAGWMIRYINSIYEKEGLGRIGKWKLKGADTATLTMLSGNPDTRGLAQRRGDEYTIYIYRHLSRTAFAEVLAHEMLHIWQYERDIDADAILMEGFCNLGSFIILNKIGTPRAFNFIRTMNANTDPIYGEGFRIMRDIYKVSGWRGVIRKLTE